MPVGELMPYTGVLRCKGIVDGNVVGELMGVGVDNGRSTAKPHGVILGYGSCPRMQD